MRKRGVSGRWSIRRIRSTVDGHRNLMVERLFLLRLWRIKGIGLGGFDVGYRDSLEDEAGALE